MKVLYSLLVSFFVFVSYGVAQQFDVPEPAFLQLPSQSPYIPIYKGRDPFVPLGTLEKNQNISITELDFSGVINVSGEPVALFTSKNNAGIPYRLKNRRLYGAKELEIDGVVGDVLEKMVVLKQGNRKIEFPRKQRR